MTAFRWYDCQWPWAYFKVIGLFHIKFLKNGVWYGISYCRQLIGNHTLAFDWCHYWWPWSTFEGHFSLGCYFHVHFSNPWHAFESHALPAIAEVLVWLVYPVYVYQTLNKEFSAPDGRRLQLVCCTRMLAHCLGRRFIVDTLLGKLIRCAGNLHGNNSVYTKSAILYELNPRVSIDICCAVRDTIPDFECYE